MKVLHKFVIKSYLGPMVLTFFIVLFIFLMQSLWLLIDELVGKGLSWRIIFEFMGWLSLTFIPMALPLSTLFASIMTMGNLGENNELLAIKAAGISLQRILRPLFVVVFIIAIGGFFGSNNLIPYAQLKMRSLYYDIKRKRLEINIPEGVFYNGLPGYSIRIGGKNPKTNMLKNVMIYKHTANRGNTSLTIADSGYIKQTSDQKYLMFTLYNGKTYEEHLSSYQQFTPQRGFMRRWFDEQTAVISLGDIDFTRTDESLFKDNAQTQNIVQLGHSYDSLALVKAEKVDVFDSQLTRTSMAFYSVHELDSVPEVRNRFYYVVNIDSIFEAMPTEQKITVNEWALSRAENAQVQIENYEMEYEIYRKQVANLQIEWHRKFTLSIACLVFFFIGAPLGAIIRKGGLGTPMVVSVLFFVFYWVVDITCKKLAQSGSWNPVFATWFSSLILAPIGIFLTYKSTTDSALFSSERYLNFFKKLFKNPTTPINLDIIKPASKTPSDVELIDEIGKVSALCSSYLKTHTNLTFSPSKIQHREKELKEIEYQYNQMLSNLASIEGNERTREYLRQYLVLEVKKDAFGYLAASITITIVVLSIIIFPIGFLLIINRGTRKSKIKHILSEIINTNNSIELILRRNG